MSAARPRTPRRQTPFRRTGWAAAALLVVALIAAACGGSSGGSGSSDDGGTPVSGGTVRIALTQQYDCQDPQQDNFGYGSSIGRQVTDSLTGRDLTDITKITPWLAKSWTVSDDARSYTFVLRDDVTFSDGSKLDAAVVKANFDTLAKIKGANGAALLQGIAATTVVDPTTVRVDFTNPNAAFLQATSQYQLGLVSLATTQKTPEQRCADGVIGSGPYVVDTVKYNEETVLKKRADYAWPSAAAKNQGAAYIDRLEFKIVPEASVRTGGVTSGQLDVATGISWQDGPLLESGDTQLLKAVNRVPAVSLDVNTSRPILSDQAVRNALSWSIDRKAVAQVVFNGYVYPATGSLTKASPFHIDQPDLVKYDPDAAKKKLDAAGWKVGSDGIREKNGQKLVITASFAANTDNQKFLELIQQQVRTVGIDFQLRPLPTADFNASLVAGDYDVHRWSGALVDADSLRVLFSTSGLNKAQLPAGNDLEPLLQQQQGIADPAERVKVINQIQNIIVERGYQIPVFDNVNLWGTSSKVHGVQFDDTALVLQDAWITS